MARVLITRRLPEGGTDPLIQADHAVDAPESDVAYTHREIVELAPQFDGIVCALTDLIDDEVLAAGALGRLRVVANVAVGYDNIDVASASRNHIAVCNTPGVLDETTADLAFSLMLAASRLASTAEAELRAGKWHGWALDQYLARDVYGTTLGLIGYGRIGRAVARRAHGFDMTVLHHTRHDTGIPGWIASLDDLLTRADIVSLHVPLNDSTRHLIGARELALMQTTSVFVNTARGPVVDEAALAQALHDGSIFAAGIDVYEREPEIHPLLLSAPRTVLLPHIGSATRQTRTRMARLACEGVNAVLSGSSPDNLVTPTC